jgi:hypothetical protein
MSLEVGRGQHRCYYTNTETGERTLADPRLGDLNGWVVMEELDDAPDKANQTAAFRNTATGNVLHSDPRLTPAFLKNLQIDIEEFRLI